MVILKTGEILVTMKMTEGAGWWIELGNGKEEKDEKTN